MDREDSYRNFFTLEEFLDYNCVASFAELSLRQNLINGDGGLFLVAPHNLHKLVKFTNKDDALDSDLAVSVSHRVSHPKAQTAAN